MFSRYFKNVKKNLFNKIIKYYGKIYFISLSPLLSLSHLFYLSDSFCLCILQFPKSLSVRCSCTLSKVLTIVNFDLTTMETNMSIIYCPTVFSRAVVFCTIVYHSLLVLAYWYGGI